MDNAFAVVLAGGRGERFWPLSTSRHPKQLLSLIGDKPLIALAVERLAGLIDPERVLVITNRDLVEATQLAAPELPAANVVGEPVGRDTAAAIALGAALVRHRHPQGVFCVLTADHIIGDLEVFRSTLRASLELAARDDVLITIGITPGDANTGYGYIEAEDATESIGNISFLKAKRFIEKPDAATARQYVDSGRFYWNSGMFAWSVGAIERALDAHRPQLANLLRVMEKAAESPRFHDVLREEYGKLEKISIDYAVMEKADNVVMARGTFAWDDAGSWTAIAEHFPSDAHGNVVVGQCEQNESVSNIVVSKDRLTALIGVRDMIVVQAEGVTLVCPRDRAQDVKKLVEKLKADGRYNEVL